MTRSAVQTAAKAVVPIVALLLLWLFALHAVSDAGGFGPPVAPELLEPPKDGPGSASGSGSVSDLARSSAVPDPLTPEAGVILINSQTGACISGLHVDCTNSSTGAQTSYHTDAQGRLWLESGDWQLNASRAGFGPVGIEVHVECGLQTVWLHPRCVLRVRVLGLDMHPVSDALVTLCRDGSSVLATRRTGVDGIVTFEQAYVEASYRVLATAMGYEPTYAGMAALPASHGEVEVEIRMAGSVGPAWNLVVRDVDGIPIAGATIQARHVSGIIPPIALGSTGSDGRLAAVGAWMFDGFSWDLGGAAYDYRHTPVKWNMDAANECVVLAPRRCRGRIVVAGGAPDSTVQWRFMESKSSDAGSGILFRSLDALASIRNLATDLPSRWPTRIECYSLGQLLFQETVTVGDDGWTVAATIDSPPRRRVYLQSLTSPLVSVTCGEQTVLPTQGAMGEGSVQIEVGRGDVTINATTASGLQYLLVGVPGTEDALLTVNPPPLTPSTFLIQDSEGVAICDVVLRLSRVTDSSPTDTGVPGWRVMVGGNVFRLPASSDGTARAALPPGRYQVALEQIPGRDALGALWEPALPEVIEVMPSGSGTCVVTTSRPRLVQIALESPPNVHPPGFWRLVIGPYTATYGGRSCSVWLTERECELHIVDLRGAELGVARVPRGSDAIRVAVSVKG